MAQSPPLVVSLSRMRKAPRGLPTESSCLSESFLPIFPKYHLQGRAGKHQLHTRFNSQVSLLGKVTSQAKIQCPHPRKGAHTPASQPGSEVHRKGEFECLAHSGCPITARLLLPTLWVPLELKLLEPQSPVTSSGCHQSISPSHYCSSRSSFYR